MHELLVFFLAAVPIVELRGAIPLGIGPYGLPVWSAFLLSVLGNLIPPLIIIPLLGKVSSWLSARFSFFEKFFSWLFSMTRTRHERKFRAWKEFALVVLVAIPLPLTGAWTASLAAFVFGIPLRRAFPPIMVGVIIAATLVTLATLGIITLYRL